MLILDHNGKKDAMLNKQFYIEFGKVAYAMSMADGEIQEEERQILFDLVKEHLAPLEKQEDDFGSSIAFYTLFSFESEDEIQDTMENAFASFLDHLHTHKINLSGTIKDALTAILKKIAQSYGRFTKTEKAIMDKYLEELDAYGKEPA